MLLTVFSDASFLNRPNSGSTIGGIHTLSDHSPGKLNASVHAESSGIPVIVSSAGEAELASAFGNAKIAHDERTILRNLGYPQPPTPIYCDNECTIGLANNALRKKQSKSMDLRWDWLRDRVAQHMFVLPYIRSLQNPADFFTKALPVHRHRELAPLFVHYPPTPHPCILSLHYPHYTSPLPVTPSVLSPSSCPITSSTHLLRPPRPNDRHNRHGLPQRFLSQP
jgi:hypothetical protein